VHVVIMGCGRVGSALAAALESHAHDVVVVDQEARAFDRLPASFRGRTVTGLGFDRDTLREAGIEQAEAFAAVSSGDNSNIISARVARETFAVPRVAARIYDPRRADVYERLGIPTVRTVRWTADQIMRLLDPPAQADEWTDPSGQVVLAQVAVHPGWVGQRLRALEDAAQVRVAFLTRRGDGTVPQQGTVLQDGDLVHVVLPRKQREAVAAVLGAPPEPGAA
jgi:trk system potassium uptake protein TrkA